MTNDGLNTITYDAENRVVSSTNGTTPGTGAYVYDALFASRMILRDGNGLRVKKCLPNCSNPTTTTVYIYSGHQVIAEYDNGAAVGSPSREYILTGGQRLAKIEAGATVYYHRDHLSVRVVTNSSGTVIDQRGHYPFGEPWYDSGTTDKLKFTTYERDAESGNDYALAREFVNRLGRFSALDPLAGNIANPQSLNRYAYATNDPIDLLDPEGEYLCYTYCGGGDPYGYWTGGGTPDEGWFILDASYAGGCAIDQGWAPCGFANGVLASPGGGAKQCPENVCSYSRYTAAYVNGNLMFGYWQTMNFWAFILDSKYYAEWGPGAMYFSEEQAANADNQLFWQWSNEIQREIGNAIYKDANGFFSYTDPQIGDPCSGGGCKITIDLTVPQGTTLVADYHAHPDTGSGSSDIGDVVDINGYVAARIDGFVGTAPFGRLEMFNFSLLDAFMKNAPGSKPPE